MSAPRGLLVAATPLVASALTFALLAACDAGRGYEGGAAEKPKRIVLLAEESDSRSREYIHVWCDRQNGNLIYVAQTVVASGGAGIAVVPGGCKE